MGHRGGYTLRKGFVVDCAPATSIKTSRRMGADVLVCCTYLFCAVLLRLTVAPYSSELSSIAIKSKPHSLRTKKLVQECLHL